jgi:hypothetical protein
LVFRFHQAFFLFLFSKSDIIYNPRLISEERICLLNELIMAAFLTAAKRGGERSDPGMELVKTSVSSEEGPAQFIVHCSMTEILNSEGRIETRIMDSGGPQEVYRLHLMTGTEGPIFWILCFKEENPWKKTFTLESLIRNPRIAAELMERFPHAIPRLVAWLHRLGREEEAILVANTILKAIGQDTTDPA